MKRLLKEESLACVQAADGACVQAADGEIDRTYPIFTLTLAGLPLVLVAKEREAKAGSNDADTIA